MQQSQPINASLGGSAARHFFSLLMKRSCSLLLATVSLLTEQKGSAQSIFLTALGTPATQDFNTLSNNIGATVPFSLSGWAINETGSAANASYVVANGGNANGDTYRYGATDNADRALGGLQQR